MIYFHIFYPSPVHLIDVIPKELSPLMPIIQPFINSFHINIALQALIERGHVYRVRSAMILPSQVISIPLEVILITLYDPALLHCKIILLYLFLYCEWFLISELCKLSFVGSSYNKLSNLIHSTVFDLSARFNLDHHLRIGESKSYDWSMLIVSTSK